MLSELNWQLLAERRRHARLVMFYKIHYRLVSICIPLTWKFHLQPTCTENIFPITSHHLVVIIIYSHSFHELFGTGIRYHRKSFIWALSKLSDVPFLPSKDCWSAPCTCCVGSHCFSMFNLHLLFDYTVGCQHLVEWWSGHSLHCIYITTNHVLESSVDWSLYINIKKKKKKKNGLAR